MSFATFGEVAVHRPRDRFMAEVGEMPISSAKARMVQPLWSRRRVTASPITAEWWQSTFLDRVERVLTIPTVNGTGFGTWVSPV
jgi:hypothetical protein